MSTWGAGPSGMAIVLLGSDARAADANTLLDQLLEAADLAQQEINAVQSEAAQYEQCQNLVSTVQAHVPLIKNAMRTYAGDLGVAQAKLAKLEQQFNLLKSRMGELEAKLASNQQLVMLGQVAYRLDQIAVDYVFRSTPQLVRQSVGDIRKRHERGELSQAEAERWDEFKRFLSAKNWSVTDVVLAAKPLRQGRFEVAHGSEDAREKVTQHQLEEWASLRLHPKDVEGVKAFIRLVAEFAPEGKVLSTANNALPVVQNCLSKQ